MKWNHINKPFKKLLSSNGGSTAGRNSKGRITSFHRGGGAKRLQRVVDLKRNTPADVERVVGYVERIEHDPNRSAKLALVRWTEGVHPPNDRVSANRYKGFKYSRKTVDPISANVVGQFSLSCLASGVRVANPLHKEGNKLNSAKDVFVSAFGSQKAKKTILNKLPRVAVCGAMPSVYIPRSVEQVVEGENTFARTDFQRWNKDSDFWKHKLKPKASVLWSSFVKEEPKGLALAAHDRETKSLGKSPKRKGAMAGRTALSYIVASSDMVPGKMVMNVASPKESARNSKI